MPQIHNLRHSFQYTPMLQSPNLSKFTWKNVAITLVVILVASLVNDFVRIGKYKFYPLSPQKEISARQDNIYLELTRGNHEIDWSGLDGTLEFIDNNYDCSDFKLVNLIRILYEYGDQIPTEMRTKIEKSVLEAPGLSTTVKSVLKFAVFCGGNGLVSDITV